ncbi:ABC transporter permease [Nocardioides sp.]|uniref:ABC transporter permease n=1 Tax=Nocardioides sp. TaxID=35761 RepID=UPI001A31FB83|nr:ABC transporter permease [Nocardioides sp.]MBJ7358932.1 ABC transporter permease [Nocardioides sp.]
MTTRSALVLGARRELGTVGLVAAMCGFYAGVLLVASETLRVNSESVGDVSAIGLVLGVVASVFIAVAVYVSAVVIVNGVDTVIAGRLKQIALLRLLGADARSLRGAVVRGTTGVAAAGGTAGVLAGVLTGDVTRAALVAADRLPDGGYALLPVLALPAAAVVTLAAAGAAWVGSRAVLRATPAQALSGASVPAPDSPRAGRLRRWLTVALIGSGALVLAGAAVLGESGNAIGFLAAALGAMLSGTGLLVGARLVVPRLVSLVSRLLGTDPPSKVAARNAVRDPGRTTRSTMGLVIGVTLVTTFAAGFAALRVAAASWDQTAAQAAQTDDILRHTSTIMICLVVVSSAIAAVGFVSTMSLGVIQRTREIGLLRALGFTSGQVRTMITKESVALSATAVGFGMGLGLAYGALGAQSLVGFQNDGFVWGLPGPVLAGIAVAGVLLVLAASWVPSSRAVAVTPVEALRSST